MIQSLCGSNSMDMEPQEQQWLEEEVEEDSGLLGRQPRQLKDNPSYGTANGAEKNGGNEAKGAEENGHNKSVYFETRQGSGSTYGVSRMEYNVTESSVYEASSTGEDLDLKTIKSEIQRIPSTETDGGVEKILANEGLSGLSPVTAQMLHDQNIENLGDLHNTADGDAEVDLEEEIDNEITDLDVERVLQKQNTHDLYCPNCNSCITRRVLLRRRRRRVRNTRLKPKLENKLERPSELDPNSTDAANYQGPDKLKVSPNGMPTSAVSPNGTPTPPVVEPNNGRQKFSPNTTPTPPAEDHNTEIFGCLSCFSLFTPTGNGYKLFQSSGGSDENRNVQDIPASKKNWFFKIFSSVLGIPLYSQQLFYHKYDQVYCLYQCIPKNLTYHIYYFLKILLCYDAGDDVIIDIEPRPDEPQPVQTHPGKTQLVQTQRVETQQVETQPAETHTVETHTVETRSVETHTFQTQPVQRQPVEMQPVIPVEARDWDILKSIVYGGLVESITSLGVVSSAAGAGATTLNVLALGLANVMGGLLVIADNLREMKNDHSEETSNQVNEQEDRYQRLLGRKQNFSRHVIVVVLSYLVFGLLPPIIYGFSFRKSDDRDLKIAAVASSSLACIVLLALAKGHVQKPPRSYLTSVLYYVSLGVMASGLSYVVGDLFEKLMEKLGLFASTSEVAIPLLETDLMMKPAWSSY
ncbi:hypothetical protein JRO89_XS15G0000200 [Xanthoceras sorbifolium]|uniref:Membrane protein of ER body-like protein n=1 Tax=Xanthoceras sorbifolium TaxID=99658 RepID=A0ABQ8H0F9_9ROSI|nr:hypothetical protein JRO89_XS15G0000200 [Xanthoceras sorbifolium]